MFEFRDQHSGPGLSLGLETQGHNVGLDFDLKVTIWAGCEAANISVLISGWSQACSLRLENLFLALVQR